MLSVATQKELILAYVKLDILVMVELAVVLFILFYIIFFNFIVTETFKVLAGLFLVLVK